MSFDGPGVELADVEHRPEQRRHRVERELLSVEQVTQRAVHSDMTLRGAIEQVQRLQRLAQIVARGGEKAALLAVLLDKYLFLGVRDGHVTYRGHDERADGRHHWAQADFDGEL